MAFTVQKDYELILIKPASTARKIEALDWLIESAESELMKMVERLFAGTQTLPVYDSNANSDVEKLMKRIELYKRMRQQYKTEMEQEENKEKARNASFARRILSRLNAKVIIILGALKWVVEFAVNIFELFAKELKGVQVGSFCVIYQYGL